MIVSVCLDGHFLLILFTLGQACCAWLRPESCLNDHERPMPVVFLAVELVQFEGSTKVMSMSIMCSQQYTKQGWATCSLTYDSSVTTRAHILHLGFLKKLLGVNKGTDTHCVLRETGQMPIFFYWFRCTIRFWNSLLSSINPLLEKIVRADLLLANRSDTWTYQVLHALQDLPTSQQFLDAIRSRQTINQRQFELTLREHIIGGWRDLDILTPYEAHHSSRIMRTYHTHFGVLLGNTSGWWDDRKINLKPVSPLYICLDIPSNLSQALSCLRLSGRNFLVQRMRHDRNRRPYELRICDRCDWHTIQDEEHILLDCPHATVSQTPHTAPAYLPTSV